jgi:hypothetical protein
MTPGPEQATQDISDRRSHADLLVRVDSIRSELGELENHLRARSHVARSGAGPSP